MGEFPFADQFPFLFNRVRNKNVVVGECFEKVGDQLIWDLGLSRRLSTAGGGS